MSLSFKNNELARGKEGERYQVSTLAAHPPAPNNYDAESSMVSVKAIDVIMLFPKTAQICFLEGLSVAEACASPVGLPAAHSTVVAIPSHCSPQARLVVSKQTRGTCGVVTCAPIELTDTSKLRTLKQLCCLRVSIYSMFVGTVCECVR